MFSFAKFIKFSGVASKCGGSDPELIPILIGIWYSLQYFWPYRYKYCQEVSFLLPVPQRVP